MKADYALNEIMHSTLTDSYFFVPKARIHRDAKGNDTGVRTVSGKKVDVTKFIKHYIAEALKEVTNAK